MWFISEPPKNPLIEFVKPIVIEQKVEQEPTVQEKIESNYYKCDESVQYIRADTAECIPKPAPQPKPVEVPSEPIKSGSNASSGWFPVGQCTWWVSTKRPVGQWNDATDWLRQARRDGYTISKVPIAGAIGWEYGHVVYVEAVEGSRVQISEANYDYRGSIRTIWVNASRYTYIY